jgi:hypothetical protein
VSREIAGSVHLYRLSTGVCSSVGQSTRLISVGSMVQIHPDPPISYGAVAQLGEHLLCKQGVIGSIPISSTSARNQDSGDVRSSGWARETRILIPVWYEL